nr:MAG TPA: hypothetical protein [Caudoviricetes sp.]
MPRKGRPQRVTGTFPEALKQGRTAMPCQMYATALRHHGRARPLQGACLCAV